jgi:serine/threonine-protein kinase HipA
MAQIKKIFVSIQFDAEAFEVGELVSDNKLIYFKYYPQFVKRGLNLSPIKLKLNTDIQKANEQPFDGLFGVFADSLPDGWGKLLLDRTLAARSKSIADTTPLDRLAYVGSQGMGALIYRPELSIEKADQFQIELDNIAQAAKRIIEGTATDVLDELFKLGGSSGGARPKILVGYNPTTQHLVGSGSELPPNYEHWLIKFPASTDSSDIAHIEYAYYR